MADIRVKRNKAGEPVAWLVRWVDGKQRYRQFRSESEAVEFRKEMEGQAQVRNVFANMPPVPFATGGFGESEEERWSLAGYAKRIVETDDIANGTRLGYLRIIEKHFTDTPFGKADLRFVTTEQVREWWAGLADGARWDSYKLLSKVFKRALVVGDREDDPMVRAPEIRKPRRKREIDFDPLTAAQIEMLADAAARVGSGRRSSSEMTRQRDRLLVLVMGFAGLRAGEAGGVRRQDLVRQGDRCQLRVRQQVVRDVPREAPHVAPLKTSASRRTITVACSLFDELVAFADEFGTAADGRLFRGPNDEARDHAIINGVVHRAAKRAGMTGIHSHLLRHSAVSILIHEGANPRQVQAFAGHANVTMTLGTYGHLFDEAGAEIGNIMERLRQEHRGVARITP